MPYSSEAGKFTVSMPNKPEEKSEEKKTDVATVKMNVAISEFNDSAYFASYADFPEKFPDAEIEPGLNEAMSLNDNRRFYQMFVLATATKFSNTDVERFISSFKIKD